MEGHFERKGGHFEGMGQFVKALASLGSLFFHNILRMVILVPKNLWFLHHIQGLPVHSMSLLILKLVGQALQRISQKSICRSLPKSVCFFFGSNQPQKVLSKEEIGKGNLVLVEPTSKSFKSKFFGH